MSTTKTGTSDSKNHARCLGHHIGPDRGPRGPHKQGAKQDRKPAHSLHPQTRQRGDQAGKHWPQKKGQRQVSQNESANPGRSNRRRPYPEHGLPVKAIRASFRPAA